MTLESDQARSSVRRGGSVGLLEVLFVSLSVQALKAVAAGCFYYLKNNKRAFGTAKTGREGVFQKVKNKIKIKIKT